MQRHSILVIDGEEAVRDSLHIVLEEDHCCYVAENKSTAKNILSEKHIDVILIDSQLIGTKSFFSYLKSNYPHTKIIIMSTYVEIDVTQQALLWGAHDFLFKPLDFQDLLDKLNQHFPLAPNTE